MKNLMILISVSILSFSAYADCVKDQKGDVVCGKGQCEADSHGKVFCAGNGGGAVLDLYGHVVCGTGYCAKDDHGKVWCSKEAGGGAAADLYGKVKCQGGCDTASVNFCHPAR